MNKQEQIEKITEVLKTAGDKSVEYFRTEAKRMFAEGAKTVRRSDCEKSIYDIQAEEFMKAGYINGADFVEWLKNRYTYDHWEGARITISFDVLEEALQEYLKGE